MFNMTGWTVYPILVVQLPLRPSVVVAYPNGALMKPSYPGESSCLLLLLLSVVLPHRHRFHSRQCRFPNWTFSTHHRGFLRGFLHGVPYPESHQFPSHHHCSPNPSQRFGCWKQKDPSSTISCGPYSSALCAAALSARSTASPRPGNWIHCPCCPGEGLRGN